MPLISPIPLSNINKYQKGKKNISQTVRNSKDAPSHPQTISFSYLFSVPCNVPVIVLIIILNT